jgi:hypothetical protein
MDASERERMLEHLRQTRADIDRDQRERAEREADPFYEPPRNPQGASPVQKSDRGLDILYRRTENAMLDGCTGDGAPSDADFDPQLLAAVDAAGMLAADERAEREHDVAELRREISRLEGKLDALLAIVGKSGTKILRP